MSEAKARRAGGGGKGWRTTCRSPDVLSSTSQHLMRRGQELISLTRLVGVTLTDIPKIFCQEIPQLSSSALIMTSSTNVFSKDRCRSDHSHPIARSTSASVHRDMHELRGSQSKLLGKMEYLLHGLHPHLADITGSYVFRVSSLSIFK